MLLKYCSCKNDCELFYFTVWHRGRKRARKMKIKYLNYEISEQLMTHA